MLSFQFFSLQIDISWNTKMKKDRIDRILHEEQIKKLIDEIRTKQSEYIRFM